MGRLSWVVVVVTLVALSSHVAATYHATYEHDEEPGYWDSFTNWLAEKNPFGARLGHDWSQTQDKVENIYRETHAMAQRRVDDLKEEALKDHADLRRRIADIYQQAAQEAEKRIDKLKRPLLSQLMRNYDTTPQHESSTFDKAKDGVKEGFSNVAAGFTNFRKRFTPQEEHTMFQDTIDKVGSAYRSAIEKAKTSAAALGQTADETLSSSKLKAQKLYDAAFHTGHGKTRSLMGRLRDSLGFGWHSAMDIGRYAGHKTWNFFVHIGLAGFWFFIGVAACMSGMFAWNQRNFKTQLNSNHQGPVTLLQEYVVVGNEVRQRKWYDYWTSAGSNFFTKQPGLRKYALHRGIEGGANRWAWVAEWSNVEDVRRALQHPDFIQLQKNAPATVLPKQLLYNVVAHGGGKIEGVDVGSITGRDTLRQRVTPPGT